MRDERDSGDERLTELLRAVRAEPEPALWTRVRARIEAADEPRGFLGWLMRPSALAASIAALALASALSVAMLRDLPPAATSGATSLTDALLAVDTSPVSGLEVGADAGTPTPADTGVAP